MVTLCCQSIKSGRLGDGREMCGNGDGVGNPQGRCKLVDFVIAIRHFCFDFPVLRSRCSAPAEGGWIIGFEL